MIAIQSLTVGQGAFELAGVDLSIPSGRYAVLSGRTGCGKTTLLEAIAGLRPVVCGRILLRNQDVTSLPPASRNIGYVPQDAAVFRTMTVRENIAFGLVVRRSPSEFVNARVLELASWLGLTPILERKAVALSGGEAQRVALGRALAYRPDLLLLDEPLSSLDETTQGEILEMLATLRKSGMVTVLHVTHSRTEADRLGDLIFRIEDGALNPVLP